MAPIGQKMIAFGRYLSTRIIFFSFSIQMQSNHIGGKDLEGRRKRELVG